MFAPAKRPYHTIIPALVTAGPRLDAVLGVMGGYMQPQGHVQVFLNLVAFGMGPQEALDAPRISVRCPPPPRSTRHADAAQIGRNYDPRAVGVALESGITDDVVEALRKRGHDVRVVEGYDRVMFGRGQVIRVRPSLSPCAARMC